MAMTPHPESVWSPRQKWGVWEICQRHEKKLLLYGVDIKTMTPPARPDEVAQVSTEVIQAVQRASGRRRVRLIKPGVYGVEFPPETLVVQAMQKVPNRNRDWSRTEKCWIVKFNLQLPEGEAIAIFNKFLSDWSFVYGEDVRADLMILLGQAVRQEKERDAAFAKSFETDAKLEIPGLNPELKLRGFQKAGIAYAIEKKRCFISDEQGLGKTAQAIGVIEHEKAYPALIVCKAALRKNWIKELRMWLTERKCTLDPGDMEYRVMEVLVVSYEGLVNWYDKLEEYDWKSIIVDEGQCIRNIKPKRTKACRDIAKVSKAPVRLILTGTPIETSHYDLVPQLHFLDQMNAMGGGQHFYDHFCDGRTDGAVRGNELNALLRRTCYIRRLKKDVLTELPQKQRAIVPIEIDNMAEYRRAEKDIIAYLRGEVAKNPDSYEHNPDEMFVDTSVAAKQAFVAQKAAAAEHLVRITKLKRLAAQGMLEGAKQWIENFVESGEKLVVFALHEETQEQVYRLFKDIAVWTMSGAGAQAAVDRFQNDPKIKIIICSIQADNAGHTLTAASNVCTIERWWTSTRHDQCEDRCVLAGTPVLTPTGWIPIENIKVGDLVVGSDGQPHTVIDAWNRGNVKMVAGISFEGWPDVIHTTHDHRFLLTNGEWVEAESLRPGMEVAIPSASTIIDDMDVVPIEEVFRPENKNGRLTHAPSEIKLSDDALFAFGFYAGDGYASIKPKGAGGSRAGFCGNSGSKVDALNRIEGWLNGMGLKAKRFISKKKASCEVYVYGVQLASWFKYHFGNCEERSLHASLLNLNIRQSKVVVEGLMASDGYRRKGRSEYVTCSKKLACQVAWLLSRCGFKPCVGFNTTGEYIISYSNGVPPSLKVGAISLRGPKKINGIRERVYDLTVDGSASFVLGTAVVHNCHRIGQRDSVTGWYLQAQGTVYEKIDQLLDQRRAMVEAATDGTKTNLATKSIMGDLVRLLTAA